MSAPDTLGVPQPQARSGPFDWYRNINQQERRTFWSCKIGYALDGMDTQMLSFVVPTLIAMWGITTGQAGLIHTSTLIASAIGGWVAGILSDRIGRVRYPATDGAVVRLLHLPVRLCPELRTTVDLPHTDGLWLRRRVDCRRGVDGRGDPRQGPRQGGGHGAVAVGPWAGA